jgi:hypothetical protein
MDLGSIDMRLWLLQMARDLQDELHHMRHR